MGKPPWTAMSIPVVSLLLISCTALAVRAADNWPCEEPAYCDNGQFLGDPDDCQCYYRCAVGTLVHQCCQNDTYFDTAIGTCNYPEYAVCQLPCPTEEPYTGTPFTETPPPSGPCSEHAEDCESGLYENMKYPDVLFCEQFYTCTLGNLTGPSSCSLGTVFDFENQECGFKNPEIDCNNRCPEIVSPSTEAFNETFAPTLDNTDTDYTTDDPGETISTIELKTTEGLQSTTESSSTSPSPSPTTTVPSTALPTTDVPGGSSNVGGIVGGCIAIILIIIIIIVVFVVWKRKHGQKDQDDKHLMENGSEDGDEKGATPYMGSAEGYLNPTPTQMQTNLLFRTMYLPGSDAGLEGSKVTTAMPSHLSGALPKDIQLDLGKDNPVFAESAKNNTSAAVEALGALFEGDEEVKLSTSDAGVSKTPTINSTSQKNLPALTEEDESDSADTFTDTVNL